MHEGKSERPAVHGRSFAGRGKGARKEETVGQRIVHIVFTPHFCYAVGEDNVPHFLVHRKRLLGIAHIRKTSMVNGFVLGCLYMMVVFRCAPQIISNLSKRRHRKPPQITETTMRRKAVRAVKAVAVHQSGSLCQGFLQGAGAGRLLDPRPVQAVTFLRIPARLRNNC